MGVFERGHTCSLARGDDACYLAALCCITAFRELRVDLWDIKKKQTEIKLEGAQVHRRSSNARRLNLLTSTGLQRQGKRCKTVVQHTLRQDWGTV
jgi:hypothetical protein